ncbi:MAG: hypothetical protein HJJLKODD_01865 [Phycisphaerae bacterium]|nr:hypothetical protein [Phycisphaerae bacterium]
MKPRYRFLARSMVLLGLLMNGWGCGNSGAFFNELGDDFQEGPGQPLPQIVGATTDEVFYMQAPSELQLTDWVPSALVNLYTRDLNSGADETVAVLLPARARFTFQTDGVVAAWVDGGGESEKVVVKNLNLQQESVVFDAGDTGYIESLQLDSNRLGIQLADENFQALIIHDLTTAIEEIAYESPTAIIQSFDLLGNTLAVATTEQLLLIDLESGEETVLAENQLVANGPFLDGSRVIWAGAVQLADDLGTTRLVVYGYDQTTGQTTTITILQESAFSVIEQILAGEEIPAKWLRGVTDGQVVITESLERDNFDLREKVWLYSLSDNTTQEIGDFKTPVNLFWDFRSGAQVEVFSGRIAWFNQDGNRIVFYNPVTGQKQKFAPSQG